MQLKQCNQLQIIVISTINRVQLQLQEACPRSGPVDQPLNKQDIMDWDGGESLSETSKVRGS